MAIKPKSIDVSKMLEYLELMIAIVDAQASTSPLPVGLQHVRDNAKKFVEETVRTMNSH